MSVDGLNIDSHQQEYSQHTMGDGDDDGNGYELLYVHRPPTPQHLHVGADPDPDPELSEADRFRMKTADLALWFEHLDGEHRKHVLGKLLERCNGNDEAFITTIFERRGWVSTDLARRLSRPLAMRVLSHLDPRSLSRAAQVSWSWHSLCIADVLWKPKCVLMGWHLPYVPSRLEKGAWKTFYASCVTSWKNDAAIARKKAQPDPRESMRDEELHVGMDLVQDDTGFWEDTNFLQEEAWPVEELAPAHAALRRHDTDREIFRQGLLSQAAKFGASSTTTELKALSHREKSSDAFLTLKTLMQQRMSRRQQHSVRLPHPRSEISLREGRREQNSRQARTGLNSTPLSRVGKSPVHLLDTSSNNQPLYMNAPENNSHHTEARPMQEIEGDDVHPRIVFISSEMPARSLLLDAVRYDVVAVPYETKVTDLTAMLSRLRRVLRGRKARSVAVVCEGEAAQLAFGIDDGRISLESLSGDHEENQPSQAAFFRDISSEIVAKGDGGRLDLFASGIASSANGLDIVSLIEHITELPVQVSYAPADVTGRYSWVKEGYSMSFGTTATKLYFNDTRLLNWHSTMDTEIASITNVVTEMIGPAVNRLHRTVAEHYIGEILACMVFGQWSSKSIELFSVLEEGLLIMQNRDPSDPLTFLGKFLINNAQKADDSDSNCGTDDDLWRPIDQQDDDTIRSQIETVKEITLFENFVRSERKFVQQLQAIHDVYAEPLLREIKRANQMTRSTGTVEYPTINTLAHRIIFTDSLNLKSVHESFLATLETSGNNMHAEELIATELSSILKSTRTHKQYLDNIEQAMSTVEDTAFSSQRFSTFLTHKRKRHAICGSGLLELLQQPIYRVRFYKNVISSMSKPSKEVAVVIGEVDDLLCRLCKRISKLQRRYTCPPPLQLPPLDFNFNFDSYSNLVYTCNMEQIVPKDDDNHKHRKYVRIHDVVILVFFKEVLIFKALSYWNAILGKNKSRTSLLKSLDMRNIVVSLLPDVPGTRHIVQMSSEVDNSQDHFCTSCKESQLELFSAIQNALDP